MDAQERMNEMASIADLPTLIWLCICGLLLAAYIFSFKNKR